MAVRGLVDDVRRPRRRVIDLQEKKKKEKQKKKKGKGMGIILLQGQKLESRGRPTSAATRHAQPTSCWTARTAGVSQGILASLGHCIPIAAVFVELFGRGPRPHEVQHGSKPPQGFFGGGGGRD